MAALPWLLVAVVRALDSSGSSTMSTLEMGARDESAHLATSLLVLLALAGPRRMLAHPAATSVATASSMLIDLDHLPLYVNLPLPSVQVAGGRPFTHSAPTIAGLGLLALASRRRRAMLASMATGVGLHFVRDIATSSGLPLWFPFERQLRRLPYRLYSRLLYVLAAVATVRLYRWARTA